MMSCTSSNSNVPKTSKELNQEVLEKILSHDNKRFKIQELETVNKKSEFNNDNFQSQIKRISVKSTEGVSISLIVKETMNSAPFMFRLLSSPQRPFFKECIWYLLSFPLLSEVWKSIKDISPKCYFAYHNHEVSLGKPWIWRNKIVRPQIMTSPEKSLILLENVTQTEKESERYYPLDIKTSFIDPNIALSALRSIGHFHGVWWQFLNKKNPHFNYKPGFTPQDIEFHFVSNVNTNWWFEPFLKPFFKTYEEVLLNHLPESEGKPLADRLMNYFLDGKLLHIIKRTLFNTAAETSIFKTMIHGDCWRNNMMWRPSDNTVMLIDYQGQVIAHPGRDIWYFIYTVSDTEWRRQHLESCKQEYFRVFSSYLDGHIEFDYETFTKELEELRGLVLFLSMCVEVVSRYPKEINKHSLFLSGKDYKEMFKVLKARESELDHPSLKIIRERLIDTARDLRDLNII